jgi:pimeloyl-ACP methyl ester carboxylesterase
MLHRILLSAALTPLICGTASRAQPELDKSQLAGLEELERTLLYRPHLYGASHLEAFQKRGGRRIDYRTSQGKQTAWLMPQTKGERPDRLWVFCGGNGSLGLDLEPIARSAKFDTDAFLFVDYPGYGGLCGGKPSPQSIRENVRESVLAAAKMTNLDPAALPDNVCVFGHSLGCSVALLAVEEFHLRSAVLCAPFTSTADMAQVRFGIPKTVPLPQSFDNYTGFNELARNHGRAWIIHGDKDTVVPVDMSRTLAKEFKDTVKLSIIPGGGHGDLLGRSKKELLESMSAARAFLNKRKPG